MPVLARTTAIADQVSDIAAALTMAKDNVTDPSDPSHDDVSNEAPRSSRIPVTDNESHDRNDDGPGGPDQSQRKQDPAQSERGQNR